MRTSLKRPAVRVGLAVVLVAILAGVGFGAYAQATAFSYQDLVAALRARGASVRATGPASTETFQGTGRGLLVNGALVATYEYGTAVAAQLDAARVSADGATFRAGGWPLGGAAVTVDWIAPPHHYRRGRVIVTYIGNDSTVEQVLTSVLGPQFAGGAVATGASYDWFVDRLRAAGATVETVAHRPQTPVFFGTAPKTDAYELRVNGILISAYEFTDAPSAATYASHIQGGNYIDPANHQYLIVDYFALPSYFRSGPLIVAHSGTTGAIMPLLTSVLGPPFTQGHF